MILRLRSRDGLERIEVPDGATLGALRKAIHEKLSIPLEDLELSRQAALLTAKAVTDGSCDLPRVLDGRPLRELQLAHGDMVYMKYSFERQVEPAVKKDSRPFGAAYTVDDVMAKQTRVERQEKSHVESVSFDRSAANTFQSYIQSAYQFSIKRGGLLYGTVDDERNVRVDFIYEPPQEGSAETLLMQRHTPEEQQVDFLAELLGYKKVGWVMSQSTKRNPDIIVTTEELLQMAAIQDELGESAVTVLVTWDTSEEGGHVHFETFQASDQCVRLAREGWLQPTPQGQPPSGVTRLVNPKDPSIKEPVIVAGKDVSEVDNDYFLCPAKILDHEGRLVASFPVENRLIPQGKTELREHLKRLGSRPYVERLSDMHLLLWLSKQPHLDPNDMLLLCGAIKEQQPILEGYRVIIDSIAGL